MHSSRNTSAARVPMTAPSDLLSLNFRSGMACLAFCMRRKRAVFLLWWLGMRLFSRLALVPDSTSVDICGAALAAVAAEAFVTIWVGDTGLVVGFWEGRWEEGGETLDARLLVLV